MSTEIKWEEPGKATRGKSLSSAIDAIADQLKANPGKWALVQENAFNGGVVTWQKRGLETATRRPAGTQKGRCNIYARLNPDAA